MQFLFTLQSTVTWGINSFWWRMTKPISLFISFHLTTCIYLFKLIDIRDHTPNWQDYRFHVSVMSICLYSILFKMIFDLFEGNNSITAARGCMSKKGSVVQRVFKASISIYQFQDIVFLSAEEKPHMFLLMTVINLSMHLQMTYNVLFNFNSIATRQ